MNLQGLSIALAAACAVLLGPSVGEVAQRGQDRPTAGFPLPDIKKDCAICHLPAGGRKPGELKKRPSQLCLDCHRDRTSPAEHKVDVAPAMPVKGLPLTDGKITCVTCHDPHGNLNGTMLRMRPKELCTVCHTK